MNEATYKFHPRTGDQLARRTDVRLPNGRHHIPYVYSDDLVLAVNAALATGRPLLLRGTPGCGKSTVARDIAFALDRAYFEEVITSRTAAVDLQWRFDTVGRLSDTGPRPERARQREPYIHPGVLWLAFQEKVRGAVVLLDEIDKADPDVPNDLLVPLGEGRFEVTDWEPTTWIVRESEVLVIITTNGERELPPAFLRRCVSLTLEDPSRDPARLLEIAKLHLATMVRDEGIAEATLADPGILKAIVERVEELAKAVAAMRRPGTAEILDAFKASVKLGITPESSEWKLLTQVLLYKESGAPDASLTDPTT